MAGVFRHAAVFGLAPLLQKAVGLVLLPLYTHFLTARDYGEIELVAMATGLLGLVLRLELRAGFMRAWLGASDDSGRARLLSGATLALAGLGAVGAALLVLVSGPAADALLGYPLSNAYVAILAAGLLVEVVSLVFHATLQAQLRSALMVTLGVAQFAAGAGLTFFCVVILEAGPIGFFAGNLAAASLALAVMLPVCFRAVGWGRPDWAGVKALVRYSAPLLIAALLFFVVRNADRFALSQFLSIADLGIYAMAWTLANLLMTMVFAPIQASLDVWRYKLHAADDASGFAEATRIALCLICGAALVLNTFGVDVFVLAADPAFGRAAAFVPLLSFAVILQAAYSFMASAFYVSGATGLWTRLFAIAAALQVGASLTLIQPFGIMGAAFGIILSNLFLYAGAAHWGRRLWRVPYPHRSIVLGAAAVLGVSYARILMPVESLPARAAADGAILLCGIAALIAVGLLRRADFEQARRQAGNMLASVLPSGANGGRVGARDP